RELPPIWGREGGGHLGASTSISPNLGVLETSQYPNRCTEIGVSQGNTAPGSRGRERRASVLPRRFPDTPRSFWGGLPRTRAGRSASTARGSLRAIRAAATS